jgi:hypothetical protein
MKKVFISYNIANKIFNDHFYDLSILLRAKLSVSLENRSGLFFPLEVIEAIYQDLNKDDYLFSGLSPVIIRGNKVTKTKDPAFNVIFDNTDIAGESCVSGKIHNIKALRDFLGNYPEMNPIKGLTSGLRECKDFIESGEPFGPFNIEHLSIIKQSLRDANFKVSY